jgi:hypothetical protein
MEVFEHKKKRLLGWLNIMEADLELREQFGVTLNQAPVNIGEQVVKLRDSKELLRVLVRRVAPRLARTEPEVPFPPRFLANLCYSFAPGELKEFMQKEPDPFSHTNLPVFYFYYSIGRWIIINTPQARREGLDSMLDGAIKTIAKRGRNEARIFDSLGIFLNRFSNRLPTALEILREPYVQKYVVETESLQFEQGKPDTLEDVLKTHQITQLIYQSEEPQVLPDQHEVYALLKAIDHIWLPETNEDDQHKFRDALAAGYRIKEALRKVNSDLAEALRPMNSAKSLDEMRIGDDLSLYQSLRSNVKPTDIWKKLGLQKEYRRMFPKDEQFWQSSLSLFEIYQRLRKAKGDDSGTHKVLGGVFAILAGHLSIDLILRSINLSQAQGFSRAMLADFPILHLNPYAQIVAIIGLFLIARLSAPALFQPALGGHLILEAA